MTATVMLADIVPSALAFYYARVLEIPTPRWTACGTEYYDLKRLEEVAMTLPLWYAPRD